MGPKGLEPSPTGLKVRRAAVTPRPQNVGRAYAFQSCLVHAFAPRSSGSPESRTQRYAVISRVRATGPRLPFANVVICQVGMAGLEPAILCSQSTWVRHYPTSRQSERADLNRRSPGPRPGAINQASLRSDVSSPCGNRTRLASVRGWHPKPIDERAMLSVRRAGVEPANPCGMAGLRPVRLANAQSSRFVCSGAGGSRTRNSRRFELRRFADLRTAPFFQATSTGFEPVISYVTGRRALQAAPRGH